MGGWERAEDGREENLKISLPGSEATVSCASCILGGSRSGSRDGNITGSNRLDAVGASVAAEDNGSAGFPIP